MSPLIICYETSQMTHHTLSFKVFNVNAPLPPRKEQDIKEPPYSPGYNQSFTTASTQTPLQCQLPAIHVEQAVLSQETGKIFVFGVLKT